MRTLRSIFAAVAFLGSMVAALAGPLSLTVVSAEVGRDMATEQPVLKLQLDPASTTAFADFTRANVGRDVALFIGGEEAMRARLMDPITGGLVQVDGGFTDRDLGELAALIRSGALPVTVAVVGE